MGATTSDSYLTALIADVPADNGNQVNRLATGATYIQVKMDLWTLNSGSTLEAYQLFMDDG
jgi:hypothetical protein